MRLHRPKLNQTIKKNHLPTTHIITYALHSTPRTGIPAPGNAKNHTPGFAQGAKTEAAHVAATSTSTLLARTAFRVLADGAFCERVRAAYEAGATTVTGGGGTAASAVGSDVITDTAQIYSRQGRVKLGFSGEDKVIEPPGLVDQAIQLVQKLITPSYQKLR